VLPTRKGASTPASRIVPFHASRDAGVTTVGVATQTSAATSVEVFFGDVLRSRIADSGSVAIFRSDRAVAAALDVLLDVDVTADRVVIAVRESRRYHHDRNLFRRLRNRDASVRRTTAVSSASHDDCDVRYDVNHVGQVSDEGL
jgi:hypothetical protein